MKLAGDYSLGDLVRTLQGNFGCREFTKDSKGKPLPDEKQYIRLELFFVAFEFYTKKREIVISKITDDGKGGTELVPFLKISGSAP